MAATKSVTVVHNNVTLTAGAGDTTSSSIDLVDGYGAIAHIKLTNGATGPTVAAQTKVQLSPDDSNWYDLVTIAGETANSAVRQANVVIPPEAKYARFVSGSNTGQDVTLRVEVSEISAI